MLNGKRLLIILVLLLLGAGGYLGWVMLQGGFAALSLQPKVPFSATPTPDYNKESNWLAYPNQASPANNRPLGEEAASPSRVEPVDVFFIHPTTLLSKELWVDDMAREDKFLSMVMSTHASIFNVCCQIYAPRYRQATLWSFIGEEPQTYQALEFAYRDVRRAFAHFLKKTGNRPFIIAGHSQGALHGMRLLEEVITRNKKLATRMVAAYLIGYTVPERVGSFKPCKEANSIRCYVNWNSVTENYEGDFWTKTGRFWLKGGWQTFAGGRAGKKLTCVNPLSFRLNGGLVDKNFHPGGVVLFVRDIKPDLPRLTPKIISARCGRNGLLYVSTPPEGYGEPGFDEGDFHVYDFHFFYEPLRRNTEVRVKSFFKQSSRD